MGCFVALYDPLDWNESHMGWAGLGWVLVTWQVGDPS